MATNFRMFITFQRSMEDLDFLYLLAAEGSDTPLELLDLGRRIRDTELWAFGA